MSRKQAAASTVVKLIVGAGQASPSPPVGPALGSKGVKSIDFCKEFNALTNAYIPGTPIPVRITVRPDRSFTFELRTPPTSSLLLTAAGAAPGKSGPRPRGANAPGRISMGMPLTAATARGSKSLLFSASPRGVGLERELKEMHSGAGTSGSKSGGAWSGSGEGAEVGMGVEKPVAKQAGGEKDKGDGGGNAQVGEVSLKHCYEIAKIKQSEERLSGLSLEGLVRSVVAQARSCGVGVVP